MDPMFVDVRDAGGADDSEHAALELHRVYLRGIFKHGSFRGVQEQALLEWSVRGRDTVVVWRTGGGKSALFAIPALIHKAAITVVVLPLIALIEDVYQQLVQRGILGVYFHHQMAADRIRCVRFLCAISPWFC